MERSDYESQIPTLEVDPKRGWGPDEKDLFTRRFRHCLFKRNFVSGGIHPMNIERCVGREENETRFSARTIRAMYVPRGKVHEVASVYNHGLVVFHLRFQRSTHGHQGLTGCVPMEGGHTVRSKPGEDDRRSLHRIPFFDSNRKAVRSVRDVHELGGGDWSDNRVLHSLGNNAKGRGQGENGNQHEVAKQHSPPFDSKSNRVTKVARNVREKTSLCNQEGNSCCNVQ